MTQCHGEQVVDEDTPVFFMSGGGLACKSRKFSSDILCYIGSSYHKCISTDTNSEEVRFTQYVYPVGKQTLWHMCQLRGHTPTG